MPLLVAAILAAALTVIGATDAVIRGLRVRRDAKRFGGEVAPIMERISATTAQIEEQLQRAETSSGRLKTAVEHLGRSRAELEVQTAAISEATRRLRELLWFMPGT